MNSRLKKEQYSDLDACEFLSLLERNNGINCKTNEYQPITKEEWKCVATRAK